MLWKKESRQPGALYADFLAPNIQHLDATLNSLLQNIDQTPHPEKSDSIALENRNKGNQKFRDSAPLEAMELYSDSLRFAVPGSEHISLAYANRSACFLQMKLYDECLNDIEYAMAAGYPEHLRPKLDDRKDRCLKEMQEDPHYPREKVSIEPDEKIPNLSKMVKIQRNGDAMDCSVVAKADIDVGQPIAVEDAHYSYLSYAFGMYCSICLKEYCNLVPCERCATAMFCPECQGHFLHEHECGLSICGEISFNTVIMSSVRDILLVMKMFTTADELMEFVEQMLKKPNELPASLLDERSKYQAYFNSPIKAYLRSLEESLQSVYPVYKTLLRIPYVRGVFKTTKHRRFLMHLIGHHMLIPDCATDIAFIPPNPLGAPIRFSSVMRSYFKHSCHPNVNFVISDGKCIWYSVKPIPKGERLCFTLTSSQSVSTKERKKFLMDMFKIKCDCLRCRGQTADPAQRQRLISDPAFRYLNANMKNCDPFVFRACQVKPLVEACTSILRKYGQMDWCSEIDFVLNVFNFFHKVRSIGGGSDLDHPLVRQLLSTASAKLNDQKSN